jgi:hypothetical protein
LTELAFIEAAIETVEIAVDAKGTEEKLLTPPK